MNHKGIRLGAALGAAMIVASIPLGAAPALSSAPTGLEEDIELKAGEGAFLLGPRGSQRLDAGSMQAATTVGEWSLDGAVAVRGFRDGYDYVVAHDLYRVDRNTDLLLHFDAGSIADAVGNYAAEPEPDFAIEGSKSLLGGGSASFRGKGSSLSLTPSGRAIFGTDSRFRDFSIEFWLYPLNAENGEVIFSRSSVRRTVVGVVPERLSCLITGGRLAWIFDGLFEAPTAPKSGTGEAGMAAKHLELRARSPLVPRIWSHHLVRFDADTGLLEYLVDGQPEATAYATESGREGPAGVTVYCPVAGAASPLVIGESYAGLIDEFRISKEFVDTPRLRPFGRQAGIVISPVLDLGYGHSRLTLVDAVRKQPGSSSIEFAYRLADSWAGWSGESPAWIPFRPGEALLPEIRGRYVQLRAELYPDGSGRLGPSLSSYRIRYEPDPPPPPIAR